MYLHLYTTPNNYIFFIFVEKMKEPHRGHEKTDVFGVGIVNIEERQRFINF
jgi:hypothetical protein